ncbi:MAG: amino acid racemase [Clostridiaceae bacterium]|nr:amino acid racemase [Clostridiaceae bacterium]
MEKTIGILGGMGPMATADLFTKIVSLTKAGCDNDHIRIYIDNNSKIPDRTQAILYGGKDPLPYMLESAKKLEQMGADCLIMPCNTAHYFYEPLSKAVSIPFLHLIEEAAKLVQEGRRPGLLATTATVQTGLYAKALEKYGFEAIVPDEEYQKLSMEAIFDVKGGTVPNKEHFESLLEHLKSKGADIFILGCTEMPIAFQWLDIKEPFVDPTSALAKAAIRFCGKDVNEN